MKLRVGIDVGGTFTDLLAVDVETGERHTLKVASTPDAPERGVLNALDQLLEKYKPAPQFEYFAHSTTIATNALLGQLHLELPRVALVTTEGFRDVIEIGRQNRSEIYNLFVTRPKPLVARDDRICVRERIDYRGEVVVPLTEEEMERVIVVLRHPFDRLRTSADQHDNEDDNARPIEAVAIGFLHSYANDAHERGIEEAIRAALPDVAVTRSSEIDPEYREYERFSTTVVNAALIPIVQRYLERLRTGLQDRGIDAPLYVMQSNGGLIGADRVVSRPASIIESGPASGVIGAAELARERELARVLSFDMGGTTAKAGTIVDDAVQVATEFEAAGTTHSGRGVKGSGYPVRFPFVDLAEVSAGGGTIAWVDEARALRVGPISAGADPGPACYGKSDRATVTDANVVLGLLNQRALLGGSFPIDAQRSRAAIATLAKQIGLSIEETASGIVRIVDAQMAKVLRIVTVERGLDPRDFALVAFGGNGPLHACALADEIGSTRIIVPAEPGVFSAYGLLVAPLQIAYVRAILARAQESETARLNALFSEFESAARAEFSEQGVSNDAISLRRHFDARYPEQSYELEIAADTSAEKAAQAFHAAHKQRFGYAVEDEPVELVNARLTARATLGERSQCHGEPQCHGELVEPPLSPSTRYARSGQAPAKGPTHSMRPVWIDGTFRDVPVYNRSALAEGFSIAGPALIEQYDATTYVAPGWTLQTDAETLSLSRAAAP